ncbi:hypothetical protein C8J56DRAFT_1075738 [Mycena floridula]|nr:hypothetical protein C8J56DRAFT_1075738 [Mycena floridula]
MARTKSKAQLDAKLAALADSESDYGEAAFDSTVNDHYTTPPSSKRLKSNCPANDEDEDTKTPGQSKGEDKSYSLRRHPNASKQATPGIHAAIANRQLLPATRLEELSPTGQRPLPRGRSPLRGYTPGWSDYNPGHSVRHSTEPSSYGSFGGPSRPESSASNPAGYHVQHSGPSHPESSAPYPVYPSGFYQHQGPGFPQGFRQQEVAGQSFQAPAFQSGQSSALPPPANPFSQQNNPPCADHYGAPAVQPSVPPAAPGEQPFTNPSLVSSPQSFTKEIPSAPSKPVKHDLAADYISRRMHPTLHGPKHWNQFQNMVKHSEEQQLLWIEDYEPGSGSPVSAAQASDSFTAFMASMGNDDAADAYFDLHARRAALDPTQTRQARHRVFNNGFKSMKRVASQLEAAVGMNTLLICMGDTMEEDHSLLAHHVSDSLLDTFVKTWGKSPEQMALHVRAGLYHTVSQEVLIEEMRARVMAYDQDKKKGGTESSDAAESTSSTAAGDKDVEGDLRKALIGMASKAGLSWPAGVVVWGDMIKKNLAAGVQIVGYAHDIILPGKYPDGDKKKSGFAHALKKDHKISFWNSIHNPHHPFAFIKLDPADAEEQIDFNGPERLPPPAPASSSIIPSRRNKTSALTVDIPDAAAAKKPKAKKTGKSRSRPDVIEDIDQELDNASFDEASSSEGSALVDRSPVKLRTRLPKVKTEVVSGDEHDSSSGSSSAKRSREEQSTVLDAPPGKRIKSSNRLTSMDAPPIPLGALSTLPRAKSPAPASLGDANAAGSSDTVERQNCLPPGDRSNGAAAPRNQSMVPAFVQPNTASLPSQSGAMPNGAPFDGQNGFLHSQPGPLYNNPNSFNQQYLFNQQHNGSFNQPTVFHNQAPFGHQNNGAFPAPYHNQGGPAPSFNHPNAGHFTNQSSGPAFAQNGPATFSGPVAAPFNGQQYPQQQQQGYGGQFSSYPGPPNWNHPNNPAAPQSSHGAPPNVNGYNAQSYHGPTPNGSSGSGHTGEAPPAQLEPKTRLTVDEWTSRLAVLHQLGSLGFHLRWRSSAVKWTFGPISGSFVRSFYAITSPDVTSNGAVTKEFSTVCSYKSSKRMKMACCCFQDVDYWNAHHAPQLFSSASAPLPLTFLRPPARCSAPLLPLPPASEFPFAFNVLDPSDALDFSSEGMSGSGVGLVPGVGYRRWWYSHYAVVMT